MPAAGLFQRVGSFLGLTSRATTQAITWADLNRMSEDLAGGGRSESGVSVTRERALGVAAWWRGINLICNSVAKLGAPSVLRRVGSGFTPAPEHPAQQALLFFAEMTPFTFWQTRMGNKLCAGNGYAWVRRLGSGYAQEMIPVSPERLTPFRENGVLRYLYQFEDQGLGSVKLASTDVLHLKGYGWDGLVGYSRIAKARETLGLSMAMRAHGSKFFANGARLGVLLEHPTQMSPESQQKFLESWRRAREGVDQAWRTVILEEGMKATAPLTMSAEDAQLIESHAFTNREIANFLDLPPFKVGDVVTKTYASVEQEEQAFLNDCIDPHLVEAEQEMERKLLTEEERRTGSHVVRFDRSRFTQADAKARGEADKAALAGMPYKTVNEIRAGYGLNPLPGCDVLKIPINLTRPAAPGSPAAGEGADAEAPVDPTPPSVEDPSAAPARAAHLAVARDAAHRALRRVALDARRAAKDPARFGEWLERVRREHEPTVRDILTPAAACLGVDDGRGAQFHLDVMLGETIGAVRSACERVYSTAKPAEFAAAIDAAMTTLETKS